MSWLALLLIGYSIFSALSLALTHFRAEQYPDQPISRAMGLVLLVSLGGLQLAHFGWLALDQPWVDTLAYRVALFAVAPAFFLFSQPLLHPQGAGRIRSLQLIHAVPLWVCALLPERLALPLAFVVGAGYLLWLARSLHALRHERAHFQREMLLLGGVFAIALGVSVLGLAQAALPEKLFFSLYAMSIGAAFFLVQTALTLRPRLPAEVREAVQTAYASSTLGRLDCEAALSKLQQLMEVEHMYADAQLDMPSLAERLGLSAHQLSELINTRLGKGFSRYLREHRVQAAKAMLCDEPSASVLSVGLNVGFTSQSNFYEAFREIEGMTPGQYRKLHGRTQAA